MKHRNSKLETRPGRMSGGRVQRPKAAAGRRVLVNRLGLAMALGVSLRTVDRMLAAGEIVPVRMRGWSVRFHLPDVVECLRNRKRKFGRKADLNAESAKGAEEGAE